MWKNEIIAFLSSVSCSVRLMRKHGSNKVDILVVVFFLKKKILKVIYPLFFQSFFFLFG